MAEAEAAPAASSEALAEAPRAEESAAPVEAAVPSPAAELAGAGAAASGEGEAEAPVGAEEAAGAQATAGAQAVASAQASGWDGTPGPGAPTGKEVTKEGKQRTLEQMMSLKPGDDERTELSKKISWILRHGAKKVNVDIDAEGWIRVSDLLGSEILAGTTEERLFSVIQESNAQKTRYELKDTPEGGSSVRAVSKSRRISAAGRERRRRDTEAGAGERDPRERDPRDPRERDPRERDPRERDFRDRDPRERDFRDRDPRERDFRDRDFRERDFQGRNFRDRDPREMREPREPRKGGKGEKGSADRWWPSVTGCFTQDDGSGYRPRLSADAPPGGERGEKGEKGERGRGERRGKGRGGKGGDGEAPQRRWRVTRGQEAIVREAMAVESEMVGTLYEGTLVTQIGEDKVLKNGIVRMLIESLEPQPGITGWATRSAEAAGGPVFFRPERPERGGGGRPVGEGRFGW